MLACPVFETLVASAFSISLRGTPTRQIIKCVARHMARLHRQLSSGDRASIRLAISGYRRALVDRANRRVAVPGVPPFHLH